MKTLRLILLVLIILAQSAWLVFNFVQNEVEVKNAPRVALPALLNPYSGMITILDEVKLEAENPELGKSLWWELPGASADSKPSVRPSPGDEVRGALCFTDSYGSPEPLAIFFSLPRKEGELSALRIEARGSSEDVVREGECRVEGFGKVVTRLAMDGEGSDTIRYMLSLHYRERDSFFDDSIYKMKAATSKELRRWIERHSADGGHRRINASMEIALRESKPPLPVALFLNGIPAEKAVELMKTDTFPMAPAAPSPKKEDEAAPESPAAEPEAAPAPEAEPAPEAAASA